MFFALGVALFLRQFFRVSRPSAVTHQQPSSVARTRSDVGGVSVTDPRRSRGRGLPGGDARGDARVRAD